MSHPHLDKAIETHDYKLRTVAGATKSQHPSVKAHKLAYEDRRVVGDPSPPDQAKKEQE